MYQTILLPVDLNEESSWKKALPAALELCRLQGAKLHVMTVIPDFGMAIVGQFFPSDYEEKALAKAMEALHALVHEHVPEVWEIRADKPGYPLRRIRLERILDDFFFDQEYRYLIGADREREFRDAIRKLRSKLKEQRFNQLQQKASAAPLTEDEKREYAKLLRSGAAAEEQEK